MWCGRANAIGPRFSPLITPYLAKFAKQYNSKNILAG